MNSIGMSERGGEDVLGRVLAILDEFRAWMRSEARDGDGARRWGVQHVLDHYDERTSEAIRGALAPPVVPTTHTRAETPQGPDYCAECSEALGDWVQWPCAAAPTPGRPS